jgi:hypothetical protein
VYQLSFNLLDPLGKAKGSLELLKTNHGLKLHNVALTASDAAEILTARSCTLSNQGRIELNLSVTKALIKRLSESDYITQENFVDTVNDLYEVFHLIKNFTSDFVGDEEVLDAIMNFYNGACGGSAELLAGKGVEKILQNYEQKQKLSAVMKEESDKYWYFDE